MIIKIDMNSDIPIYEQLCNSIILGIAKKQLLPDESMPTVRKLGVDLGINLHTVNKAYNILKQKGYLSVNRSKGVVVNHSSKYKADDEFINRMQGLLFPYISECIARDMEETEINNIVSRTIKKIRQGSADG